MTRKVSKRVNKKATDEKGNGHVLVLEASDLEAALEGQGDLGGGVGHLLLDELVGGQRPAELDALQRVVARRRQAKLGRTQHAPRDAEARAVQTTERTCATSRTNVNDAPVGRSEPNLT